MPTTITNYRIRLHPVDGDRSSVFVAREREDGVTEYRIGCLERVPVPLVTGERESWLWSGIPRAFDRAYAPQFESSASSLKDMELYFPSPQYFLDLFQDEALVIWKYAAGLKPTAAELMPQWMRGKTPDQWPTLTVEPPPSPSTAPASALLVQVPPTRQ